MTNEEAIELNKNLMEYMRIQDRESDSHFLAENYLALEKAIESIETLEHLGRFMKAKVNNLQKGENVNPDYLVGIEVAAQIVQMHVNGNWKEVWCE